MQDKVHEIQDELAEWLHETQAIRICPENKPFWYTSGTIGPYYINTHFLYGNENKANALLKYIDEQIHNKYSCPVNILKTVRKNYMEDKIYKGVIDRLAQFIYSRINVDQVDYISGGERRDWFFSLILSEITGKPHLTIYKDMDIILVQGGVSAEADYLSGKRVLHIADLVTEASSYKNIWIPAIAGRGGRITCTVAVVDRRQGGREFFESEGISFFPLISIEGRLFERLESAGKITKEQLDMVKAYMQNPRESMRSFLVLNPGFLRESLESDSRTRERAKKCLDEDIYNLRNSGR